jgi:hypothetical protein
MAKNQREMMEVVPPAEEPEEMPLPSDPKVIFLGGLFGLALLAVFYVAAEIILPLVLALVVNLLLQPAMRLLERWHILAATPSPHAMHRRDRGKSRLRAGAR